MLELKNITKIYNSGAGAQKALDNVSISFAGHEFVSILGASGSGKTTLLNLIGGLDGYDEGDMIVDGTSTKSFRDKDWDSYRNGTIGFVFQSFNLISRMSALRNVEIPMIYAHKKSPAVRRERAAMLLEKVGLSGRIHHQPNEMSGGQRQRVAIARALTNEPPLILADEPTGNLDTASSVEIMEMFSALHKAGATVVVVTHEENIAAYTDRMLRFSDGKLISDKKNENPTPVRDLSIFEGMYKGESHVS